VVASTGIGCCFLDGSIKHIHAVLDPVADRSSEVYEIVGTATDITEQIRAKPSSGVVKLIWQKRKG
jgi:hypothetical protein